MSGAILLDTSRATLPGGAVSVATSWAQRALIAAGLADVRVDGKAGVITLTALDNFRRTYAPDDTIRPSGEASSPTDRAPARVIIGQKTERALAQFSPSSTAPTVPSAPRQTIGPHLDPEPAASTRSGSDTWMWVVGGAVAAALGVGAWWYLRGGSRGRAPKNRKVPYKRAKARPAPRNRRRR